MGKDSALRASQVIWRTVVLSGAMLGGACGGSAPATPTTPEPVIQPAPPAPVEEEPSAKSLDDSEGGELVGPESPGGSPVPPPAPPVEPVVADPVMAPPPPVAEPKKKRKQGTKKARTPEKDDSSDPCSGGESRVRGGEGDGPPQGRGFVLA